MRKQSQETKVMTYIRSFGSITSLEASDKCGIIHLPRRIGNLKELGVEFSEIWETKNGKRYKRWSILKEKSNGT